jgi:hypothetical protein
MFRSERHSQPHVMVVQETSSDMTRRKFLRKAGATAGKVGVGVAVGAMVVEHFTDFNVIPDIFKGETREQVTERVRRGILDVAELITLKIDDTYKIVVEKDAPILDSIFDKKATGEIPTRVLLSADLKIFDTAPEINDVNSKSNNPQESTPATLPPIPFVGGMPAIEVSEDRSSVIVRLPHLTVPDYKEVILDLENAKIVNGQGGVGDRLQHVFNIHKIDPTKFYLRAQKEAVESVKREPDLLLRAEGNAKRLLESMLRFGFQHASVEFVDRVQGPQAPAAQALNQKVQTSSGR